MQFFFLYFSVYFVFLTLKMEKIEKKYIEVVYIEEVERVREAQRNLATAFNAPSSRKITKKKLKYRGTVRGPELCGRLNRETFREYLQMQRPN